MIQHYLYSGRSGVVENQVGRAVRLAANLAREPVSFDAELRDPLRFREAICALHDIVVSDLRFVRRDKTAYKLYREQAVRREGSVRREAIKEARQLIAAQRQVAIDSGIEREFEAARRRYWGVRDRYSNFLRKHDPELWRKLVPCDPVVSVAEDVVFFECFSRDESAYGCLSVDRSRAFGTSSTFQLGTTNVDYSPALYEQFQTLRTYRSTRLKVTPDDVAVHTESAGGHREEKIDLPATWLRGFMKLQAAMTMPTLRVRLPRETVYSILAFLKRHLAKKSPRALRFELEPGRSPRLVLEPWEKPFDVVGAPYEGPPTAPVRIWGTRRLLALARTLPLVESVEVHLLATGLPSFWVAKMGDMSFTLGLSGWTTNDWSSGSALDLLQPPRAPTMDLISRVASILKELRAADLSTLMLKSGETDGHLLAAALRHLANSGQVIFDIAAGRYRFRQIMAQPLGEAQLGPEDAEVAAARALIRANRLELVDRQDGPNLTRVIIGKVESKPVEILVDADDRIKRGKCLCGHFQKFGLRNGPCRHMIALRWGTSAHGLDALEKSDLFNRSIGRSN